MERDELLAQLRDIIQNAENLPQNALYQLVNYHELVSIIELIYQILIAEDKGC